MIIKTYTLTRDMMHFTMLGVLVTGWRLIRTENIFSVKFTFALSLTGLLSHLGSNICKTQDHSHSDTTPLLYIIFNYFFTQIFVSKMVSKVFNKNFGEKKNIYIIFHQDGK